MKKRIIMALCVFVSLAVGAGAEQLTLTSPGLEDGARMSEAQVYDGFGCSGGNVSPALQWKGAPPQTKSFALTVYDPDAPTGSGWWHWVIFNIPADVHSLKQNAGRPEAGLAPEGSTQSRTDFGQPGYGGACPPPGDAPHRYIFTIYALNTEKIDLDKDAPAAMVGFYINQHVLAKDRLTVTYSR